MILTVREYLPMFMNQAVLAPIFMAAAKDTEAEVLALDNLRVAAGQSTSLPDDLTHENVCQAKNLSDVLTVNLMSCPLPAGEDPESAYVVQALRDEAVAQTESYQKRVITGNDLTDQQILNNAYTRRDQALYKALCLRLAESLPK